MGTDFAGDLYCIHPDVKQESDTIFEAVVNRLAEDAGVQIRRVTTSDPGACFFPSGRYGTYRDLGMVMDHFEHTYNLKYDRSKLIDEVIESLKPKDPQMLLPFS